MRLRGVVMLGVLLPLSGVARTAEGSAGEYAKHLDALGKLSVAVAEAMPADQYGFKPHPESMNFGELMAPLRRRIFSFVRG